MRVESTGEGRGDGERGGREDPWPRVAGVSNEGAGLLAGVRVVEFQAIGPAPLCGMLLADHGADVVVIERPRAGPVDALVPPPLRIVNRGKRRTLLDLKTDAGRRLALDLAAKADVLIEGLRPGAMERLGLGPDAVLARRPTLVYARITGWGQTGPRAATAGHDITYLALTGGLDLLGRAGGPPTPPANLLGDYAGGAMFGLAGILAALAAVRAGGKGQVIDAAMIDGVAALLAPLRALRAAGAWPGPRGTNLFDTGAPFYDVYRTSDGGWVAVGALEDEFFAELVEGLGLESRWLDDRHDPSRWPELRAALAQAFGSGTRAEWDERFRDTDACVAPVLSLEEAESEAHNRARQGYQRVAGVAHPAPAPRCGVAGREPSAPPAERVPGDEILAGWE